MREEIVDAITDKVTEKVARKLDQAAEKTSAKLDAAAAKTEAKLSQSAAKLERQTDRLHRHERQSADAFERLASHLDTLEVWTRGAGGGRRPRFTRDELATAAVRIADTEGFEALSMRRLAAELGAGTMTLYHYIKTKDELLTLVNDAVMGEVLVDGPLPASWREAISLIADRSRQCLQRHPWILDLTEDPAIGPNQMRHFDQSMEAVSGLGGSLFDRLDVVTAVDEYVFGYCVHARHHLHDEAQQAHYSEELVGYMEELLASGDYPHLQELAIEHPVSEFMELANQHSSDPGRFQRNLDRLLDGIEADVARREG